MNQYKSIFLGTVDPNSDFSQLKRAVNSQKCVRAGGKHNDLDDVGRDSYHHTFFEMLGNWSFGDYFKKEAIEYAWELLTKIYGLDPSRLYATYFEGHEPSGLTPDIEAKEYWRSVGVAEDHILPGNLKDNFWEMGDQGPCGPCSEIHYDRIGGRNARDLVNKDDPDVLEIWNLVFIQFNREADKSLKPLPNKHIDTGMGFERLVSVLQNKSSNYDTDVFGPLFTKIQEITGARPYAGKFGKEDSDYVDTAYRVVSDHVRMCSFAIADGGTPDNVGRGYVVRRVLRRGARYARKNLNAEIGSFFSKLVPVLVDQIGEMFPEIKKKEQDIKEILDEEEKGFAQSLDRGEAIFHQFVESHKDLKTLPGDFVWRLYDTYGFPIDLTQLMAEEYGLTIDYDAVEDARKKAREISKGQKKGAAESLKLSVHDIAALDQMPNVSKTNDAPKYGTGIIKSKIKVLYHDKKFLKSTSEIPDGDQFGVILDKTNFYAESGGQIFDTGRLVIDGQAEIEVVNVQAYGGYVLHSGFVKYGTFVVDDEVIAEFDELRRQPIRLNHTGTHILNYALRAVLGIDVDQKGSLVAPEKLRFDFSHKSGVLDDELKKIEGISNGYISDDHQVFASDVELKTAKTIESLRAVFGETYPDPVRVVSIGMEVDKLVANVINRDWWKYSIELCGGTHVKRTGEIKEMVIIEESGIAKGIRRIVAVTGEEAAKVRREAEDFEKRIISLEQTPYTSEKDQLIKQVQADLATLSISTLTKKAYLARFDNVLRDATKAQKAVQKAQVDAAMAVIREHYEKNQESKVNVIKIPSTSAKAISEAVKKMSQKKDKSVYLIGTDNATGKVPHACFVTTVSCTFHSYIDFPYSDCH